MLREEIARRIKLAMKSGDTVEKEVLRVALGDIQTAESRESGPIDAAASDAAALAVVRKLAKSITETLTQTSDAATRATLEAELAVLRSLLPATLSVDDLVAKLAPQREALVAAPNDGAATGLAMKALKAAGVDANGKDVTQAVKRLRTPGA
ncbi:MAG TPA: GatB/YqeY domain-containing protein [Polyangiaceae bacterium]|nr:GatB/YqeY domain-containing protein [Polyangiaceae bacterium]